MTDRWRAAAGLTARCRRWLRRGGAEPEASGASGNATGHRSDREVASPDAGQHDPGSPTRSATNDSATNDSAARRSAPNDPAADEERVDLLRATAGAHFGYESFRPGQLEAMTAVLSGQDTLCVLPTGAGKSAVYQVPALLIGGPTVVVSPLIALQRDQIRSLSQAVGATRESGGVAANSQIGRRAYLEALNAIVTGDAEFLFLSPEQLGRDEIRQALAEARPSLFVVDEAHCISAWGHEFRPDYLRLGQVIEDLGRPRVIALTATASPPVREEIVERLRLRDPAIIVRGFDRPNIFLEVRTFTTEEAKARAVVERVAAEPKPGIVYAATRRHTEELATELAELGLSARAYHAGLKRTERTAVEAAFIGGDCDVVVATTAFGMGIDKADVRFVIHAQVPDSLDSYYQEIGRAGRDGEAAIACLFFRAADLGLRRFFASGLPDVESLQRVATLVGLAPGPVTPRELAQEARVRDTTLTLLVDLLEQADAIAIDEAGAIRPAPFAAPPKEAAARALEIAEGRGQFEQSRIDMMRGFAETTGCRRQLLLAYFGETLEQPCGHCDTCRAGTARHGVDQRSSPFPIGGLVRHATWGHGTVMRFEGDRITVLFDESGYRTLSLGAIEKGGLLKPLEAPLP
ncbi:MAG: RecQ family ATP-dependent DNA helicase [Frankia sp.]